MLSRAKAEFAPERMYLRHEPRTGVHVWHTVPSSPGDIGWQMWVTAGGSWLCLRINSTEDGQAETQHYYDQLVQSREEIDAAFGEGLDWIARDDLTNRQLRWDNPVRGGYRSEPTEWEAAADSLVAGLRRLVDATRRPVMNLTPYVAAELPID